RCPAANVIGMGAVALQVIPQTLATSSAQRASQVIEQQVGSARQIRPAQKLPCWQVRLIAPPLTQMSCVQVSGSRPGGVWLPSVMTWPFTVMLTGPSLSAENR